jgi:DNA-binding NarL/FixJ family response regulator
VRKILIVDSSDFFSFNLKESLQNKLTDDYSIVTLDPIVFAKEAKNTHFDHLIYGINNSTEEEYILITDIKKNYYHANILIVAQDLTIDGIKRLKSVGISTVLLKPINIAQIIERLKK